jgi:TIR domain
MPETIFISHRAEYASLVHELKKAIETTSRRQFHVVISEDLSGAEDWREAIKSQLQRAKYLFLVYGAPYEDWSWCFYEAGYFAGTHPEPQQQRSIYCIARPEVEPPGPLSDLQMVTNKERLIADLIDIYNRNNVKYDAAKLRESINQVAKGVFGRLAEFVNYPRVYFIAKDADFADFGAHPDLPAGAMLKGDPTVLMRLFGIGRHQVPWADIVQPSADRTQQEAFFFAKWIEETKRIILAARENRFITPQTVLVRGSQRVRFLLYVARSQGDGVYCCEFLVIDEVGGPALGLPQQQHALLTSVRMGFRFRYEFIKRFAIPATGLSDDQRRTWIREIPRIIDSMLTESHTRGNLTLDDLQNAFGEYEADRIGAIVGYWEGLKEDLYGALGLSLDGKAISDQGLIGPNVEKYRLAFDALRLSNIEFLSRCCARASGIMTRPEEELKNNAKIIDDRVLALGRLKAPPAPCPDLHPRAA